MSAKLRLLVPQGTTNYIVNPSARYNVTGTTAVGSTLTRTLDEARFGVSSIQVVTDGLAIHEGFFYRVNSLEGVNDILTVSAYVRGSGYVRIRLIDNPNGKEWKSLPIELLSDRWQRIEVTGRCTGSDDMRLYVESSADAAQDITFYVDGLQMERYEEATTYCDGDQPGCRWDLVEHNSQSIRSPYTREGGRWVEIAGPDCEKKNLYMTVLGGMGVAPIQNQLQPYADSPGDYFQGTKVLSRPLTLSFHTKRNYRPRNNALPSLRPLHALRQQFIDVIKPDRTAGAQSFRMEYSDGEIPLFLHVRYDGGMEGEWDVRNQFLMSFPVRLLATSPFFVEDDQEITQLNFRNTQTINYAVQRVDGEWSEMNGGFNAQVLAFEVGPTGEIIAVGEFVFANNDVNAVDPMIFANRIAYWDGTQWNQYGSGANDTIRDVAIAPNGYIYVVGDFTSIGGVAANYVAYWDGSSWNAMGTGLSGPGYAVKVSSNGDVYIGFDGTSANGVAAYYVTRWDGSFHAIGDYGGLNDIVYSIDITDDGTQIFLGGAFTDEYSDPGILQVNYVAVYQPLLSQFDELGTGFDDVTRKILVTPSNRVYAGGDFLGSNDGNLTFLYLAYWNGASWFGVGTGTDNTIRDLSVSKLGNILLGGDFDLAGSSDSLYAALYNGTDYVNLDLVLANPVYAVTMDKHENMFVGPNGTTAEFAAVTTVENIGSAETNPKVYIEGPATLLWIENQTTKRRVYTDIDIDENENITIDFGQGTVTSNIRGNLAYAISPGSDLRAWTLVPGDNKIAMLMTADVEGKAYLSYVPRHWSADSTARNESL